MTNRQATNAIANDTKIKFKLIERRINRLPTRGKIALAVGLILSLLTYASLTLLYLRITPDDANFLKRDACPFCYGRSLCRDFYSGHVSFSHRWPWSVVDLFGSRQIYTGLLNGQPVLLKKMVEDNQIDLLKSRVCGKVIPSSQCGNSASSNKRHVNLTMSSLKMPDVQGSHSSMVKCPSTRLLSRMTSYYKEKPEQANLLSTSEKLQLLSSLWTNSEPILIQTFPAHENWPFLNYIGSCGQIYVEGHAFKPLKQYYYDSWQKRVDLAFQVLSIADRLTTNELGYALYWLNLNSESLGVTAEGKVVVVNTQDILVVDTAEIKRDMKDGWDTTYHVVHDECQNQADCRDDYETSLCSNFNSDYNYYAVCRNIFGYSTELNRAGLLHGLPSWIEAKWDIGTMINECIKPKENSGRLKAKSDLLKSLGDMVTEYF